MDDGQGSCRGESRRGHISLGVCLLFLPRIHVSVPCCPLPTCPTAFIILAPPPILWLTEGVDKADPTHIQGKEPSVHRAAPLVAHEEMVEHRACGWCQAGHTVCAPQPAILAQLTPGYGHWQQHQEAQQGQPWGRETVIHHTTSARRTGHVLRSPQSRDNMRGMRARQVLTTVTDDYRQAPDRGRP